MKNLNQGVNNGRNKQKRKICGGAAMKRARIISLIILIIGVFVTIDLGFNFLKSMVPALNDGIGCFSIFQITGIFEPFGDNGWSQARYLQAFEKSVWITFAIFVENIILTMINSSKNK